MRDSTSLTETSHLSPESALDINTRKMLLIKFAENRPTGLGDIRLYLFKSVDTDDIRRQTTDEGRQSLAIL